MTPDINGEATSSTRPSYQRRVRGIDRVHHACGALRPSLCPNSHARNRASRIARSPGRRLRPLLSILSRKLCEPARRCFEKGRFKMMVPTGEDRNPDRDKDNAKQRLSDLDCPRKLPLHRESCLP